MRDHHDRSGDEAEEEIDRRKPEIGIFEGKRINMMEVGGVWKGMDEASRTARWKSLSQEVKDAKFKKRYYSSNLKKLASKKNITDSELHIKGPFNDPKMPLAGKFPDHKYIHRKKEKEVSKRVDYSIDEIDFEWLTVLNIKRYQMEKEYLTVPTFEFWLDRLEKNCKWKPKEYQKLRDDNGDEVDDVCNICLDGETTNCNQIVYCDKCEMAVHQDCYGIPFLPEGSLECRRCAMSPGKNVHCVLCPSKSGAFKQVDHKRWVHVLCVIWVDETHFGNTIFMENVQNVEKALYDRRALSCQLCKNRKEAKTGACIQCSETKCTASFHVTCARNAGLVMRINETEEGHVNRFVWCNRHTPPETEEDRQHRQLMMRNARRENERKLPTISMPTLTSQVITDIQSEMPVIDHQEIVLFWYQKRQNRLGAPLLKNYTAPDELAMKPRRTSKNLSGHIRNEAEFEEIRGKFEKIRSNLVQVEAIFDLVVKREEQKLGLLNSSLRMFERGFKPTEVLCSEVIMAMITKDKDRVFTQPVTDVPGYLDVIKRPMDLKTMTEKAQAGKYQTLSSLMVDVNQMLENCATFNRDNPVFKKYGQTFKKATLPILQLAEAEESERNELRNDAKFMEKLLNGMMREYSGFSKNEPKIEEIPAEAAPKKRAIEEPPKFSDSEEKKKKTFSISGFWRTPKNVKEACDPATANRKVFGTLPPKSAKKGGDSGMKQTTLISFFGSVPTTTQKPPASSTRKSLFGDCSTPSTSKPLPPPPPPSSRTRSSTVQMTSAESKDSNAADKNRRSTFRMSSSALQSPLQTDPRKVGTRALDSDDDDDVEIVIQPTRRQMTADEIKAEKRKCVENEAKSKFAHNQLVVVEGRAAKVIECHLAHLSDSHSEARQSMLKKRREVLGEIATGSLIYVEFFQKVSGQDNFKWVDPDNVDLLDLNNLNNSRGGASGASAGGGAKISGLKAAKEWHQKVINGEVV